MSQKIEEYRDRNNFSSGEYLHINSCGKQNNHGKEIAILRSRGRVDFHLLYLSSGSCRAEIRGEAYQLGRGDGILYRPGERQLYIFQPEPTVSYWIHFTGVGADELLKRANLWTKNKFSLKHSQPVEALFDSLIQELTLRDYQYPLACEGKLIELVSAISRQTTAPSGDTADQNRRLIYNVIEVMRERYRQPLGLDGLADLCRLSRGRFEHLFKEVTGLPPHRYLTKLRMDTARYLLGNSTLSIAEVSETSGYSDPLYFSKLFRRYHGLSPTEYRRQAD